VHNDDWLGDEDDGDEEGLAKVACVACSTTKAPHATKDMIWPNVNQLGGTGSQE